MKKTLLKTMAFLLAFLGGTNVAWAEDWTLDAESYGRTNLNDNTYSWNSGWPKSPSTTNNKFNCNIRKTGMFVLQKFTVNNLANVDTITIKYTGGSSDGVDALAIWSYGTTNPWPSSTNVTEVASAVQSVVGVALNTTTGTVNTPLVSGGSNKQTVDTDYRSCEYTITGSQLTTLKNGASDNTFVLLITNKAENILDSDTERKFFSSGHETESYRPTLTVTYKEDLETKTVTKNPTADTFLRLNNTSNNGGQTYIEVENSSSADFLGLMSFDIPTEEGMEIDKVTLRLTTKRVKSSRATVSIYDYPYTWAESAAYAGQSANITATRATTAIGTFSPEGQLNKDVSSDEITTESYQVISGWQNSVDLTSYVKSQTGSSFSIMIDADADKGQLQFFSKEATAFTNEKTSITNTADDLVPLLTYVFKKSDSSTPTSLLTKDETQTVDGTDAYTEVYILSGSTNTVKVTVTKTADTDGADVAVYGTVTATAATDANSNVIVTLTVTPENASHAIDGTPVVEIVASDSDGDQGGLQLAPRRAGVASFVTVTDNNDGTYSFTMPSNSVEVSAKFKKLADVPVVAPTITYDEENNKVTLAFGAAQDGYNQATKIYYTTDGSDPKSSETRLEITAETEVEVTSEMTTIKAVGVYDSNFSDVVEQTVSRRSYLNVTKEWVAFCSPNTYSVPTGLKAYTISAITQPADGQSGTVTLKEQSFINKNTPMLIQNTTDNLATSKFQIVAADDQDLSGDMCEEFKGTTTATTLTAAATKTFYVLKDGEFLRVANPGAVSAYNCWLEIGGSTPSNAPRYSIEVGGNTTRIDSIGTATIEGDDAWYTLSGVRVAQPTQKGIYIRNGKKIIVK